MYRLNITSILHCAENLYSALLKNDYYTIYVYLLQFHFFLNFYLAAVNFITTSSKYLIHTIHNLPYHRYIFCSHVFFVFFSLSGADIFRLNFSHGEHKQKSELVDIIRAVEKKYDHPIAILADLQVKTSTTSSTIFYNSIILLLLMSILSIPLHSSFSISHDILSIIVS